jgi:hypothetical protein
MASGWTLRAQSFAVLTRSLTEQWFRGDSRLHRDWGAAFCLSRETEREDHWTLLGDHAWVKTLMAAGQPPTPAEAADESHSPLEGVSTPPTMIDHDLVAEWPTADFRPGWVIRGWPADWSVGPLDIFPWPSPQAAAAIGGGDA